MGKWEDRFFRVLASLVKLIARVMPWLFKAIKAYWMLIGAILVGTLSVWLVLLSISKIYFHDHWDVALGCTILLVLWGFNAAKKDKEMNELRSELNKEIKRLTKILNENEEERYRAIRKFQKDKGIKLTYDEERYLLWGDRSREEVE